MPFDPAGFRHVTGSNGPKVTVLLPSLVPTEPGGGGDPRRVHIEMVVHVPPPPRRWRSSLWWWLAALLVLRARLRHNHPLRSLI
jgi:hypothetical protein